MKTYEYAVEKRNEVRLLMSGMINVKGLLNYWVILNKF